MMTMMLMLLIWWDPQGDFHAMTELRVEEKVQVWEVKWHDDDDDVI